MGTSLKVHPVAGIPLRVRHMCPRLLINREPAGLVEKDEEEGEEGGEVAATLDEDDEEGDGAGDGAAAAATSGGARPGCGCVRDRAAHRCH